MRVPNAVYHYNKNFHLLRVYDHQDGLPDFEICGMMTDNENNLWFNSENSICRLDLAKGGITTLSEKDGFQKQDFTPMLNISKSSLGELYLGGGIFGQGFNRISPSNYSSTPAFIYLQKLLINQKPASLASSINSLEELSLSYFENQITIETGIIDFYTGGNSHIRYKLGENSEWQYPANSARYTIYYQNLPPGKYKLIMQASNASNEFTGPEKILMIGISPPWWQTWWARFLFGMAFAFVLWKFIQYRSRNLKQRNVALEEKVMHRTRELKHSLEELRDTQTQLIQREKMASLGELTAGIAHEIQNPLNFVNNFSDLNKELLLEMKTELEKGNIQDAGTIADDVIENEEKINHHGRRAGSIVKGMLQHSRTNTVEKEPDDINALADEYMRLSYHGLRAKDKSFNASMRTDFDETLEPIYVIPQDIGRVFLNIFNNSFYAVSEKRKRQGETYNPEISVSTKKIGNRVEIKIRDNGTGIPQTILDKIYQPFFTTKPPGEGTGLGLSLSYDIITKIHNGELKVETKEGEFSEFTILLPN
jgi:signal transduction histidine kinase